MLYFRHNRIHGYSQVPDRLRAGTMRAGGRIGNGVQVSDRTAAVKWSRGHKPLVLMPRRGRGDETESEDLPVKIHVLFFGPKNDMSHGAKACGEVTAGRYV